MKYNIIGDIHGRTCWKELVRDNMVNIFVGDYFSPYHDISWEGQKQNFLDIIAYRQAHPLTILLIGNHDEDHWHLFRSGCSRHDYEHDSEIKELFEEFADYFQVAYSIADTVLVTHAGVSYVWYERYKNGIITNTAWNLNYNEPDEVESPCTHEKVPYENPIKFLDMNSVEEAFKAFQDRNNKSVINIYQDAKEGTFVEWKDALWRYTGDKFVKYDPHPGEIAAFINGLWKSGKYEAFDFRNNASYNDYCGDSVTHGPMWIRPGSLIASNILAWTEGVQIFGHTIDTKIRDYSAKYDTSKLLMVDCLEGDVDSVVVDLDDMKIKSIKEFKNN